MSTWRGIGFVAAVVAIGIAAGMALVGMREPVPVGSDAAAERTDRVPPRGELQRAETTPTPTAPSDAEATVPQVLAETLEARVRGLQVN